MTNDLTLPATARMLALAWTLVLSACADGPPHRPAAPSAAQSVPSGSVYQGWQVFQEKCAGCHGPAASGTGLAPDLLPPLRDMGPRRFAAIVLKRYSLGTPAGRASIDGGARKSLTDEDLRREDIGPTMPAWEDEPRVSGHIADLYAYLVARSKGGAGTGRPAR